MIRWSDGQMPPLSAQLVTRCLHKMVARLQIVAESLVAITVSIMLATYFTYLRCFVVQSILHKLPLPHTSYMFKLLSCELSCKNMQEFCAGVLPESGLALFASGNLTFLFSCTHNTQLSRKCSRSILFG